MTTGEQVKRRWKINHKTTARGKKKKKIDPSQGDESAALHGVIDAMMKALGRGGLTYMSQKLGTASPSTLRKRMAIDRTAFDEITMAAVLLAARSKFENAMADQELLSRHKINGYEITIVDVNGVPTPYWRTTE